MPDSGGQHTDRQLGWIMAIGGVVLLVGQATAMLGDVADYATWWNAAGALRAAVVVLFAVLGWWLPFGVLRLGWLGVPILGAVLHVTAFLAYTGSNPDQTIPWVWSLEPVDLSFFVLWLRPWIVVAVTFVSASLPALSGLIFTGSVPALVAVHTPIHMANLGFVALFVGMRTRLGRLREAERQAREQHEQRVWADAEASRQETLSGIVHDEILAVLTAAMSFTGAPPAALKAEAWNVLRLSGDSPVAVSETRAESGERSETSAVMNHMVDALSRADPECRIHTTVAPGAVPTVAVEAICAAAAEALRNSRRHAGETAQRVLNLTVAPVTISVTISDDGRGFVPGEVRVEGLGIRNSIVARMRNVGGEAVIDSAPGAGTQVRLTWLA